METTMSDDFLARWSRRKRASAGEKALLARAETLSDPPRKVVTEAEPAFDPATLPPIDSITAISDISAFLQKGVPAELTRAALRRVWTADPAIRDFVGLAENAWDFTDPNAMPGFGPLESSEEVRRMIAGLVERIGEAARPNTSEAVRAPETVAENSSDSSPLGSPAVTEALSVATNDVPDGEAAQKPDDEVLMRSSKEDTATQNDVAECRAAVTQLSRRSHGGALPQ
jgi:hypothetical protein